MLKELLLKKGWAGKTISRQETVERLNPVARSFVRLNYSYDAGARDARDPRLSARIESMQKTARADVGKIAETIFSCGGTAYSGTDLEPSLFHVGDDDASIVARLLDLEQDFQKALDAENEVEHQMRTRAILGVVKANSDQRLALMREIRGLIRTT